ncbi:liprin-beta-1-like isoform X3 [Nomascus leucogenys]|uniref:liprin-beta-1-like isoform X3 n=1 Tax=Nomascus leucogenys TaxID=61853 RepID=UPI00122D65CF|nr:liprin-beta-1-like isoform X3 [Nomascus leucogenys]
MVSIIQQCPLLGLIREINDLRLKVSEMGSERLQYEKKHKSTKSLMAKLSSMKIKVGQMQYEKQRMEQKWESLKDELASLKEQLEEKESEVKRLQEKLVCKMKGEGIEIVDRARIVFNLEMTEQSAFKIRKCNSMKTAMQLHLIRRLIFEK